MNVFFLKFLEINDCSNECMVEKMLEFVVVNFEVIYWNIDNIFSFFILVKCFLLCLGE